MSREFTAREKALLLVLVVMILVVGYVKLIWEPVELEIRAWKDKTLQTQLMVEQQRLQLANMKQMQQHLEEMKESGSYTEIPAYDNSGPVMAELHGILAAAKAFTLEPEAIQKQGYILQRPVTVQFLAADYETARGILQGFHESAYCSLVTDLELHWQGRAEGSPVQVSLRITYYEVSI